MSNEQQQTRQDNEHLLQLVTNYRQAVESASEGADELARQLAQHVSSWVLAGGYRLARDPQPLEQLAAALAPAAQRELVERIEQLTDEERQTLALAVELAERGYLTADVLRQGGSAATSAPGLSEATQEQLVSRLAALSPNDRQTLAQTLQLIDLGYLSAGDVLALDIMSYEHRRFDDERPLSQGGA